MRQEYLLGKALRQEYVAQYHLLPEVYDANTLYARSSDLPRTLMSAQSILFGLYPLHSGPKALPQGSFSLLRFIPYLKRKIAY